MFPCGLHMLYGKKGSGKSMYGVKTLLSVVANTDRVIWTNLAIKFPQCQKYLEETYGWKGDVRDRIWIDEDFTHLREFWLHLGFGWSIRRVSKEEWRKGKRLSYTFAYRWNETVDESTRRVDICELEEEEFREAVRTGQIEKKPFKELPPVQYLIDEVGTLWDCRDYQHLPETFVWWLDQQRKLKADCVMMCPDPDGLDKKIKKHVDDWMHFTNWGRTKRSIFRLPKVMTYHHFDQVPTGIGVKPMCSGTMKVDISGLGQCYDTSAGVGIDGGMKADTDEQVSGIHWAWFIVVAIIATVGIAMVPSAIKNGSNKVFGGVKKQMVQPAVAQSKPLLATNQNPVQAIQESIQARARSQEESKQRSKEKLRLTGLSQLNDSVFIAMSDGTSYWWPCQAKDRIVYVGKDFVVMKDGERITF